MRDSGIAPQRVLSSPARRARQTIECVARSAGWDDRQIVWEDKLYLADRDTLLECLSQWFDGVHSLLIVGHNPGLAELAEYLSAGPLTVPPGGKLFPTAALACFTFGKGVAVSAAGSAATVRIVRPRELKDGRS